MPGGRQPHTERSRSLITDGGGQRGMRDVRAAPEGDGRPDARDRAGETRGTGADAAGDRARQVQQGTARGGHRDCAEVAERLAVRRAPAAGLREPAEGGQGSVDLRRAGHGGRVVLARTARRRRSPRWRRQRRCARAEAAAALDRGRRRPRAHGDRRRDHHDRVRRVQSGGSGPSRATSSRPLRAPRRRVRRRPRQRRCRRARTGAASSFRSWTTAGTTGRAT